MKGVENGWKKEESSDEADCKEAAVAVGAQEEHLAMEEVEIADQDRRTKLAIELTARMEEERQLAEAVAKAAAEAEEHRLNWVPEKLAPSDEVTQRCLQAAAGWGPAAAKACLTTGMR